MAVLDSWNPRSVGVTWSASDDTADSITFGMYRMLESLLAGSPYADRLVPAGDLAGEVRRRKLPDEIEGIHSAIAFTEQVFQRIEGHLKPGISEKEMQRQIQEWVREAGFGFSWEELIDPIVSFGPRSEAMGHTPPGDKKLEPGHLIHVDLGVQRGGFASDLQRTWYWLKDGETAAPEPVSKAFDATRAAIDAGMAVLKPGKAGHEVDAESRRTIVDAGYPEPAFAFGHHVGRVAHDGAGTLGPRWERYGNGPDVLIEPSNVFAVEMDIDVPGFGLVGLEEEAVVEAHGAHFLSNPQRELWLLPRQRR
jgi:Xaa-Pro aminopeptidase